MKKVLFFAIALFSLNSIAQDLIIGENINNGTIANILTGEEIKSERPAIIYTYISLIINKFINLITPNFTENRKIEKIIKIYPFYSSSNSNIFLS